MLQPAQHARRGDGRKHERVDIGQPQDIEPGRGQPLADLCRDVTALVLVDLVLIAPQERMGRHGDQHLAAGAQHPANLAQRRGVIVEVLDNIESRHQVKGAVLEGQGLGSAETDISQAPLAAVTNGLFIDVHALRLAVGGKVGEHGPGPAADVKDPAFVGTVLAEVPVEDLEQDAPPADEPPVDVLHLAVLGVVLPLQISLEPW